MNKTGYYTEWGAHTPIGVVNGATKERYWFFDLDEEHKEEALGLPAYDINLRRWVDGPSRKKSFIMNRKALRF